MKGKEVIDFPCALQEEVGTSQHIILEIVLTNTKFHLLVEAEARSKSEELSGDLSHLVVDCNCISSSWITFVEIRDSCFVTATRRNFLALVITLFTVAFTACLQLVSNACDSVDFKLPLFQCRWSGPLNKADVDGAIINIKDVL